MSEIIINKKGKEASPNIFPNLIEEDIELYHANPAWSSTDIRKFLTNTPEWKYNKINNIKIIPTASMNFGNAFDTLMLEPELWDKRVVVSPNFNKRTIQGREDFSEFQESNKSKIILTDQEWERLRNMENVFKSSEAFPFIQNSRTQLSARTSMHGVDVQVRPDAIKKNMIIDIKTTSNINKFGGEIYKYRYDIQALFYKYTLSKVEPDYFNSETTSVLIVIDVKSPHFMRVYKETPSLPYYYGECCELFFSTVLKKMKEEAKTPFSMVDIHEWDTLRLIEQKLYPEEL